MREHERTARTYFYELWRAGTAGIIETAGSTFLLTIAVKALRAGAFAKALVAGSGSVGLLLSPVVVSCVAAMGWPISRAASRILAVGAVSMWIAAAASSLPLFIVGSVLAMASSAAI